MIPPLPIYAPEGVVVDMAALRAAKEALVLDYVVQPVDAAVADLPGVRILAVGSPPPWVCDSFLVGETAGEDELMRALEWVLGADEDEEATTALDVMRSVFGDVVELDPGTPMHARFTGDAAAGAAEMEDS